MIAIKNGRILTPDKIIENKVLLVDNDRISDITDNCAGAARIIDAHGRLITPGFIDIHSDKIEHFILPRPTSLMDFEMALKECERELLHQGITTMYHSLSLFKDEFFGKSPLRTKDSVLKMANLIQSIHERDHLIHHRLHLRIEIDNLEAYDIVKDMIARRVVHEISFMDHTPGQGQYQNLAIYEHTLSKYNGNEIKSIGIEGIIEYHRNKQVLDYAQIKELTEMAHQYDIAVASHDDDTEEKLLLNKKIGVDISEFPIHINIARSARAHGFFTIVGAPNILLGGSHSGNMSAAQAICEGCADILCSDYYPSAMIHSLFILNRQYKIPLWDMFNKVTLNPARAMKIDTDYGSIEIGKKADLLIIALLDHNPVITHVLMDGNTTARVEYRRT